MFIKLNIFRKYYENNIVSLCFFMFFYIFIKIEKNIFY